MPAKAGRCWYYWQTAARHAGDVVRYLKLGRVNAAQNAEHGYRQCFRLAARCEGIPSPPGRGSCSQYSSGLSGAEFSVSKKHALKIAKLERDSLRLRAKQGGPCAPLWRKAARSADQVVAAVARGDGKGAVAPMYAVAEGWHRAARCKGYPTPSGAAENDSDSKWVWGALFVGAVWLAGRG